MNNRILTGILLLLLSSMIVSGVIILLRSSPTCKITLEEPPSANWTQLEKIADTTDYKSLATFDGYLIYYQSNQTNVTLSYLALGLESLTYNSKLAASKSLTLKTNCAKIELLIYSDSEDVVISGIKIKSNVLIGGEDSFDIRFANDSEMNTPFGHHYRSSDINTYEYLTESGYDLRLVVNKLEFEIHGNPKDIKAGRYSTPPFSK